MATLVPVDYDPFADMPAMPSQDGPAPLRITIGGRQMNAVPVDHDPFANEAPQEGAGIGMNAAAGLNEGIYGTLGAPVDFATGAINLGVRGINALTGSEIPTIDDPFGGSRSIARGFGAVGVPDPESVQAVTPGEKLARAGGQGAGYMIAPELAVRGGAQALGRAVNPYLEAALGRSGSAGELAGNAVVGAAAGVGGSAAGQVVPEPYRPIAEMGGNLVGGGIGAIAASTPRLAREGIRMAGDYAAPLTAGGRERMAATALRDAASDPYAAREALESGQRQLVPGSQPTTFQQSGDMGLGGLERAVQTRAPEQFNQRRADQNSARLSALEGIQPDGKPEAVVNALRQNLADLDRMTGEALEGATANARSRTSALGGEGTPEGYGSTIRQQVVAAEDTARTRERALWSAVDPDGTLALPADDIHNAVVSVLRELPRAAKPMSGEERAIFSSAARFNGVMPFSEVAALRSRVSTEMRAELSTNGRTPVYARLSQLRGAIERNIEAAVSGKAAKEAEAVASGAMSVEQTMAARVAGWRDVWREDQALRARADAGAGPDAAWRAGSVSGARRGEGEGGGGFSNPTRDPGISGPSGGTAGLTPNFDEAALGRLTQANDATKQRAQTFGRGPVGEVLRRSGSDGPFHTSDSIVPQKFFPSGAKGFEDIQALRQASDTPETMATVRDYAVSTLRRMAEREDGTLDPNKVSIWRHRYQDALRAFPEIERALADPVRASETMVQLATARKQALDEYRQGLVGRLIGVQDPSDVTRAIGGVFSSQSPVKLMRQLASETSKNPEAYAGLRKAVADHFTTRLISNTEAATSGRSLLKADQFQTFISQNEAALRVVMKPGEVSILKAIAADLQRSNRSRDAVKLPGQSNTAQDLMGMANANRQQSWLSRLVGLAGNATAGAAVGGPIGAVGAILGAEAISALRKAGIQKVDDLITDAMLNPERGLALLVRAPAKPTRKEQISFAQRYRRAALLPTESEFDGGD